MLEIKKTNKMVCLGLLFFASLGSHFAYAASCQDDYQEIRQQLSLYHSIKTINGVRINFIDSPVEQEDFCLSTGYYGFDQGKYKLHWVKGNWGATISTR